MAFLHKNHTAFALIHIVCIFIKAAVVFSQTDGQGFAVGGDIENVQPGTKAL
jgi:hypothetical protein